MGGSQSTQIQKVNIPSLIIFDFHGTISLKQGSSIFPMNDFIDTLDKKFAFDARINNLKKGLRKYKLPSDTKTNWYVLMNRAKIDPEVMIPTLNDFIKFIDYVTFQNPTTIFAIASMVENDSFIFDMMKYVFEIRGKISPFTYNTIVGSNTVNKYGGNEKGKLKHISVLLKNIDISLSPKDIVVIDDSITTSQIMTMNGICGILISDYFTIKDWNKNSCGYSEVPSDDNN